LNSPSNHQAIHENGEHLQGFCELQCRELYGQ